MSLDLTGEPFAGNDDDRVFCSDCREFVRRTMRVITVDGMQNTARPGDCLAAIERRRLDVHSQYGPADVDLPRRCEFFLPLRAAADQRTGCERYPTLWAEYEAKQDVRNRFQRDAAARGIDRAKAAIGTGAAASVE